MVFTSCNANILKDFEDLFELVEISLLNTVQSKPEWDKDHDRISQVNEVFNLIHENASIKTYVYFKALNRLQVVIDISQNYRYHLWPVPLPWLDIMQLALQSNRVDSKWADVYHRTFRAIVHKHS